MEIEHLDHLGFWDVILTLVGAGFTLAFGLWARRLDKALDLLEKLQKEWYKHTLATERRLTRLEFHNGFYRDDYSDDEEG